MDQAKESAVEARILAETKQGKISCPRAFAIAEELDCPRAEVGQLCNKLKVKVADCQLGCF